MKSNFARFVLLYLLIMNGETHAKESIRIEIEAGSSTVIQTPSIKRIAVGNGNIVQATVIHGKEVLIFGKGKGATTLEIWLANGKRQSYRVAVSPEGLKRVYDELNLLLKSIPNARAVVAGDRIVIQGEDLSDSDRNKIANLSNLYPELVDFTNHQGWDRMVMLDVQVIELPSTRMQELGVRWDASSTSGMQTGVAWESGTYETAKRADESGMDVAKTAKRVAGMLGLNAVLFARVSALAKSGEAVILAQPQLLARNGSTASFLAGGEVPYAAVDKDGRSTTVFKKYGVSLNITPHADRMGAIRSKVEIEVSSVDATIAVPGGPALKIRRASTEFNVRSGQTIVIGGFLSRERTVDRDGIAGVSDVPILGRLFGVEREQTRKTELAIFVTPIIVDADDPYMSTKVHQGKAILKDTFQDAVRITNDLPGPLSGKSMNESFDQWEE